jgi:hypothetical protein
MVEIFDILCMEYAFLGFSLALLKVTASENTYLQIACF